MKQLFADHLRRYGPEATVRCSSLAAARAYCRQLARTHYENFLVGSIFLPRRLIHHFHALYAWCRWADDLGDEVAEPQRALELLSWWRNELLLLYAGQTRHPVLVALAETVAAFAIPPQPFLDLLSAFEQDQRVRRYETFAELLDYCRRSANPVGRMVLHLFRCCSPDRVAYSDAICTGLQLANFWQDVARDWERGRVYLPQEDRERFGYSDADLSARRCTPAFVRLMEFQVSRARGFLLAGAPLVDLVPEEFQPEVRLFLAGGCAVLDAIQRQGGDVWQRRPVVSPWTQARLVLGCLLRRYLGPTPSPPRMPRAAASPPNAAAVSIALSGCCPTPTGRP